MEVLLAQVFGIEKKYGGNLDLRRKLLRLEVMEHVWKAIAAIGRSLYQPRFDFYPKNQETNPNKPL